MKGIGIDYAKYSIEELLDVKANIDTDAHPERYQALLKAIEEKIATPEEFKKENAGLSLFQELESDSVAKKLSEFLNVPVWDAIDAGKDKPGAFKELVQVFSKNKR